MDKLKVAIVDDHEMFRSGIKTIISLKPEMEIVIEAESGNDFLTQLKTIKPDIVLLDISMPGMEGCETTTKALDIFSDLKIIVLSIINDDACFYKMVKAGVKGFVLKDANLQTLFQAIHEVSSGGIYFAQELLRKMVLNIREVDKKIILNEREKSVLYHICNGFTNKEISEKLFLSIKTIEKYRNGLLKKTQTRNTAHLVMFAIKEKLISI